MDQIGSEFIQTHFLQSANEYTMHGNWRLRNMCIINDRNYDRLKVLPPRFHCDTRIHPAVIFLPPHFPRREPEFLKCQGPFHDLEHKHFRGGWFRKKGGLFTHIHTRNIYAICCRICAVISLSNSLCCFPTQIAVGKPS